MATGTVAPPNPAAYSQVSAASTCSAVTAEAYFGLLLPSLPA